MKGGVFMTNNKQSNNHVECEKCDWLWGNGENYCPYCHETIDTKDLSA
jgi:RNA polymerase subunit RPABC4/transcription elongation factor Spt4